MDEHSNRGYIARYTASQLFLIVLFELFLLTIGFWANAQYGSQNGVIIVVLIYSAVEFILLLGTIHMMLKYHEEWDMEEEAEVQNAAISIRVKGDWVDFPNGCWYMPNHPLGVDGSYDVIIISKDNTSANIIVPKPKVEGEK